MYKPSVPVSEVVEAQEGLKLEHKMKATVLSTGCLKQNGNLKH